MDRKGEMAVQDTAKAKALADGVEPKGLFEKALDAFFRFVGWLFDIKWWYEQPAHLHPMLLAPDTFSNISPRNREVSLLQSSPIKVSDKAASKIFAYARAVNSEIGGLLVIEDEGRGATVTDAILYKQKVSCASVELNPKDLARQLHEIALTEPEKISKIKGWWHSHCDMAAYWSFVDDACFTRFLKVCPTAYGLVVNKAGHVKARMDIRTGIGVISVGSADYDWGRVVEMPECLEEVKLKVRQPSFWAKLWPFGKGKHPEKDPLSDGGSMPVPIPVSCAKHGGSENGF